MRDLVFVLEQSLGHAAHAWNLQRALTLEPDIESECLCLDYNEGPWMQRMPGLRNWSLRASWRTRRWLENRVAAREPDAIFIHTQVASLLSAGIMRRIPTVVSMDATPVNFDRLGASYGHRSSHRVVEGAKRAVNSRSFAAAASLVTWSRWAAESLQSDYGVAADKIKVIPPGVDLELFRPAASRPTGATRLLFVGGDLARKGGLDLLAALPQLTGPVELDLVTRDEVPPLSPGATVRIHKNLKPQSPDLVRLFREADVFVLPTHGECFGQVIAEAMACGVPVVTTAVGAIPELVADRVNGLLVSPGSPRALAQALNALIADAPRRKVLGAAGYERATRDHDMSRNNRAIFELMRELCAGSLRDGVAA